MLSPLRKCPLNGCHRLPSLSTKYAFYSGPLLHLAGALQNRVFLLLYAFRFVKRGSVAHKQSEDCSKRVTASQVRVWDIL